MLIQHTPFNQLADIADGRLIPDQEIVKHLDTCPVCAADLAWLKRTISLLRSATTEEPPQATVALIKTRFRQRHARTPLLSNLIQSILRFDSIVSRPAFGLRAGAATERQLLFSADSYEIDLRIMPQGNLWVVSGQILSSDSDSISSGTVELMGPDVSSAEMNELSEFSLPPVAAGSYKLAIRFAESAVIISDLELGV